MPGCSSLQGTDRIFSAPILMHRKQEIEVSKRETGPGLRQTSGANLGAFGCVIAGHQASETLLDSGGNMASELLLKWSLFAGLWLSDL